MEYFKTYCQTHTFQPISNFCADPGCLQGLCATCICEHTQLHISKGTSPIYQNIKDTFVRMNNKMRDQIDKIEEDKQWLITISQKIEQKRNNVKYALQQAKEDCLALVKKHFEELQTKIDCEISNQGKKNSLHSNYRLQTLNTLLLKQISALLLYSKDLNSSNFLQTTRLVEYEVFPNSNQFHSNITKQLKLNEVYTANVLYSPQFLNQVNFSLKKLINLEFLLPRLQLNQEVQKDEAKRANSLKKTNSVVINPNSWQSSDFMKMRISGSTLFQAPIQQVLNSSSIRNQNDLNSPSSINRGSKLASGLKVIRQSRRQIHNEDQKSMSNSSVSYTGKQNDYLAQSTFYNSNFFSR